MYKVRADTRVRADDVTSVRLHGYPGHVWSRSARAIHRGARAVISVCTSSYVLVDTNIVTLKLCKFQITGYNSNRYHFMPGSTVYRCTACSIFISVAKTKSELSRSPMGIVGRMTTRSGRRARWCTDVGLTGKCQPRPRVKLRYVVGIVDGHNIAQFHTGAGLAFVDTQPFLCENA
jgi:hypothetical protein